MKSRNTITLFIICLCLGVLCPNTTAKEGQAGSVLLYPYFNNNPDYLTIIRITNVSSDTVTVRLVHIDEEECSPEDQWITLTGGDNFTFEGSWMNADLGEGFMYAHVVESSGPPQNVLVGNEMVIGPWTDTQVMSLSINALPIEAINVVPDNKIHMDGVEYEVAPKSVYFPGFFAQDFPSPNHPFVNSRVIFINLTGGKYFRHHAKVLVYNDNEQPYSATHEFGCFDFVDLTEVSGATRNSFLLSSYHDIKEPAGLEDFGLEAGWIKITGDYAHNPGTSFYFANASLLAVLVERMTSGFYLAELPFHVEDAANYNNGMLWSTSIMGN